MHNGKGAWIRHDSNDDSSDRFPERVAKADALILVPRVRVFDVGRRVPPKYGWRYFRRSRFSTSDHGSPSGRPARISSSSSSARRSNSAFHSSDSGNAADAG